MNPLAQRLRTVIADEEPGLRSLPEHTAATRADGNDGWSRKQELGHLIDSATNNRVHFMKAALEGEYDGPSYDGCGWVELGGYAALPWNDLVELWRRLNSALAVLVDRIPQERLSATCRIAGAKPVTLEFIIDDYILHMQHHLDHILARNRMTSYPGASMGI
jgi:hypothetical protein